VLTRVNVVSRTEWACHLECMKEMTYTKFWSETFNRGDIGTNWRILLSSIQFSGFTINFRDIRYGRIKWIQLS
jgi:hypothetical protein